MVPEQDVFYFCFMYTKHEASQLRREFWTVFGLYMIPIPSADGDKISWINYKTGEKNVYFKMHADGKEAVIGIELTYQDIATQKIYLNNFITLKQSCTKQWARSGTGLLVR